VPVPSPSAINESPTTPATLSLALPQVPTWTNLVREENGTYKQTAQHPELNTCLSAAVKRANANVVLVDSFPGWHTKEVWLLESPRTEFARRRDNSRFINAVAERSDVDVNYRHCLISTVITVSRVRL